MQQEEPKIDMVNPLLERLRVPGETFRLPSQGLFYTDGELDPNVKNGEVEVNPMTAIDEIVLNTPDKLLSGKAIEEIFTNCIPQIKKPGKLLARDVDFLMVCLRVVSFGPDMKVTYQHTCEDAKVNEYLVPLHELAKKSKPIDPSMVKVEYEHTLPNGQLVKMKPFVYEDVVRLYQTSALMKLDQLSESDAESLVIETLATVVFDVDGVTNKNHIRAWVMKLPMGWKRELEGLVQKAANWGVEFKSTHTCQDCKQKMEIWVQPNPVSFFT